MKLIEPDPALLKAATAGDLVALDALLLSLQSGVFNLALRMLGRREDAADATQEILLKVVTHLAGFRAESAFTTWVWRIARNHLLSARASAAEAGEVSLDALAERLGAGLDLTDRLIAASGAAPVQTPEDKLQARQLALSCTQGMLMALDREQRLVYVLDTVFALPSKQAAEVLGLSPENFRQRLSRARARLSDFVGNTCGLVNEAARCRCEKQLPALRHVQARGLRPAPPVLTVHRAEQLEAERAFAAFTRVGDAAALFRAHPQYRAPAAMLLAIRAVLTQEGFMGERRLQQ